MNELHYFLSGGIVVEFCTIALFFFRYFRKTGDSLFLKFSAAFLLLGLERIIGFFYGPNGELLPYVYLFRLAAFSTIIAAIILKNVGARPVE